jgi:hypothetical protein
MGKVLPKKKFFRSAIYTPKLNVGSHIDNVKYSLEHLIFSNAKETGDALLKKRIKVVAIVTVLLMIVGSALSPKGTAEVATFYPTACLGGWSNPNNAEGEPQTKSNTDESSFSKDNSAFLPTNTKADIYCGNFIGQIEQNTKPTKILVSLSMSKGADIILEQKIIGDSFASSSSQILDSTSTVDISFTLASSTEGVSSTSSQIESTSTDSDSIIDKVGNVIDTLFGGDTSTTTETVPVESSKSLPVEQVPEVQPQTAPVEPVPSQEPAPTSMLDKTVNTLFSFFFQNVFAAETINTVDSPVEESLTATTSEASQAEDSSTKQVADTSFSSTTASSTSEATSTSLSSEVTPGISLNGNTEDDSQSNFLDILYTFDGVTWKSLGKVNEESIQYRTFEIPVTASTSWSDLGQLQIKVQRIDRVDLTPTMYLDAIKVEVLYETPVIHPHPDFARDTILQDKNDDNIRVINIINSDTNANEIWYTTINDQGEYGIAPGSWVEVKSDQTNFPYKLIDIYGQNIFLEDSAQKMLWVKNLLKETNDGTGLVMGGTTTAQFTKSNGEEWVFEYNNVTKVGIARIKN